MHICIGNVTTIVSNNGLSPNWHQGNIWTNAEILLIGPLGTNLSEILIQIHSFSFIENVVRKMVAILFWPQCVQKVIDFTACCPDDIMTQKPLLYQCFIVREIHWSLSKSTHTEQKCRVLMFPLLVAQMISLTNGLVPSDLRCHGVHVMSWSCLQLLCLL